jgi:hypothetical protein
VRYEQVIGPIHDRKHNVRCAEDPKEDRSYCFEIVHGQAYITNPEALIGF